MPNLYCTALYDYTRPDESGLSFTKGQIIQIHNQLETGWWDGVCNEERGWFPSNYVSEPEELAETPTSFISEQASATWLRQVGPDGHVFYRNQLTNEIAGEAETEGLSSDGYSQNSSPVPASIAERSGSFSGSIMNPIPYSSIPPPSPKVHHNLPPNWSIFTSDTGASVYFNTVTKEIRWTPPGGGGSMDFEPDVVAASHNYYQGLGVATSLESGVTAHASGNSLLSAAVVPDVKLATPSVGGWNGTNEATGMASVLSRKLQSKSSSESLMSRKEVVSEGLPRNWGKKFTSEGRPYYYNMLTDETVWDIKDISNEPEVEIMKRNSKKRYEINPDSDPLPPAITTTATTFTDPDGWSKLITQITSTVSLLSDSAQKRKKSRYVPQATSIVECIRVMLVTSASKENLSYRSKSPRRKEEEEMAKILKVHQKTIMASLTKLVGAAKIAAGMWPPPDSVGKMMMTANEVLGYVKSFATAAQEAGIMLPTSSGTPRGRPSIQKDDTTNAFTAVTPPTTPQGLVFGHARSSSDANISEVSTIAPSAISSNRSSFSSTHGSAKLNTRNSSFDDDSVTTRTSSEVGTTGEESPRTPRSMTGPPPVTWMNRKTGRSRSRSTPRKRSLSDAVNPSTNTTTSQIDLVSDLEYSTINAVQRLQDIAAFLKTQGVKGGNTTVARQSLSPEVSARLIAEVRSVVTEVGAFLSSVDDLPLLTMRDDVTIDFKFKRGVLYNCVSALVMATSNATSMLTPANVVEEILDCCAAVDKGLQELLISTKLLLEDVEDSEQPYQPFTDLASSPVSPGLANISTSAPVAPSPLRVQALAPSPHGSDPNTPETDPDAFSPLKPPTRLPLSASIPISPTSLPSGPQSAPPSTALSNLSPPRAPSQKPLPSTAKRNRKLQRLLGADITYNDNPILSLPSPPQDSTTPTSLPISSYFGNTPRSSMDSDHLDYGNAPTPRGDAWYLSYDYAATDVVFNMEGQVKGGRLDSLVERLTLHDSYDPAFMRTFLVTYRSFTTSNVLFRLLERRFSIMRPEGLVGGEVEEWERLKRMPIQVRVFNVMKSWIENYCMDDPEDRGVLMAMKRFAQTTMSEVGVSTAIPLLQLVERRELNGIGSNLRKMVLTSGRDVPPPILPKTLNSIKLLDVDPLELARQLTIVEARAFCKLMPTEFLKLAWGREGDSNVRRMSRTSNRISRWVAESILREEDARRRVALIKHYIHVADRCRQMNNFNTLISIIAGLDSAPIHRLNRTWSLLSTKSLAILDHLRVTMNPARNFSRYREALHTINPPCVPFLGFYLTDLTFIEEGSPDFLRGYPPGMINFSKRMKTAEVILEIQQYQNVPYFLTVVGELQDFLKKCLEECGEVDEERLYEMSLALEPRESKEDKAIPRRFLELVP